MCRPRYTTFGATIVGSNMSQKLSSDGLALIFFSYSTPVAALVGDTYYRTEKKWSNTTAKHIRQFGAKNAETKPQEYFDELVRK